MSAADDNPFEAPPSPEDSWPVCDVCGLPAPPWRNAFGHLVPGRHDAPCGAPCFGGGGPHERSQTHRRLACPRRATGQCPIPNPQEPPCPTPRR